MARERWPTSPPPPPFPPSPPEANWGGVAHNEAAVNRRHPGGYCSATSIPTRPRCRLSSHARPGRRAGRQSTYLAPFKTPSYAVAQPPCGGNCLPYNSQHPARRPQSSRRSALGVLCRLEAKPTSVARGTASYARPDAFWKFYTGCSTRTLLVAALDLETRARTGRRVASLSL